MISPEPVVLSRHMRLIPDQLKRLTASLALVTCAIGGLQPLPSSAAVSALAADVLDMPAQRIDERLPAPVLSVARVADSLISVGPHGLIQRSTDAGKTWQQVASPVSSDLTQVRFADDRNGWIVGHDSLVMHSGDAGLSWQVQLDGRSLLKLLNAFYQARAEQGDAEAASMLGEFTAAASSSATPGVLAAPFLDVLFDGHGNGFAVGAFGMILHSADNGGTWEPWVERSDNDRRMHLYGLAQRDGVFYVSGEQGLLLKQDVAGQRFTRVELPYSGTLFGVSAVDDLLLVHGLRGNLYVSRDDGQQWQKIDTGLNSSLVSIVAQGEQLIVVSQGGQLLALDRRTLVPTPLRALRGGEIYGASETGRPEQLLVTRFSGAKVVAIAKAD